MFKLNLKGSVSGGLYIKLFATMLKSIVY